jgi:hypothetical protein
VGSGRLIAISSNLEVAASSLFRIDVSAMAGNMELILSRGSEECNE